MRDKHHLPGSARGCNLESHIMIDPFTALRLERGTQHLYVLGPRAVAGFLQDLTARIGGMPAAVGLLAEYERRLTPGMIVAAGGDRFPTRRPVAVPQ